MDPKESSNDAMVKGDNESIADFFDKICFSFGDQDAIVYGRTTVDSDDDDDDNNNNNNDVVVGSGSDPNDDNDDDDVNFVDNDAVCYYELQECSRSLAYQLLHRYRPDYILVDCFGHVAAEVVAILASIRIRVPFVPVSISDQHAAEVGGLQVIVNALNQDVCKKAERRSQQQQQPMIVAICCCDDDQDPRLGVFYRADVHTILYIDKKGNMKEQIMVPSSSFSLPNIAFGTMNEDATMSETENHVQQDECIIEDSTSGERLLDPTTTKARRNGEGEGENDEDNENDNLYVLFTSGTSSGTPKAVIGSHISTYRRLEWFRNTFDASPHVARRTKLTFVDGITELLGPLLHPPSKLIVVDPPERLASHGILAVLNLHPTQITLLPSQLAQMLLLPPKKLTSLERIIVSGEPLSEALWNKVQMIFTTPSPSKDGNNRSSKHSDYCLREFINLYGQTESTGDILCADLMALGDKAVRNGVVAVGKPILAEIHVSADSNSQELVVAGNLANGYLGQVPFDSFSTGDVGFCHDGVWYIQGRCDDVVKINGVWTSPSEVEAAFIKIYNIEHAVAAVIGNDHNVYVVSEQPITPPFSREYMKEAGLQWNVIPRNVFIHAIPISTSGAGKVDRSKVKELVQDLIAGGTHQSAKTVEAEDEFYSIVAEVLGIQNVDESSSFAELGGDSALAVTLLYKLKSSNHLTLGSMVNATDILTSNSISELHDIVSGKIKLKRQKLDHHSQVVVFVEKAIRTYSRDHIAIQFKACVDASPALAVDGASFYTACQGGVVQRIDVSTGKVLALKHFVGWMAQADCIPLCDGIVLSLYQRNNNKGMVSLLSHDLSQILWEQVFDSSLQITPLVMGNQNLGILLEGGLVLVDLKTGVKKVSEALQDNIQARPVADRMGKCLLCANSEVLIQAEWSSDKSALNINRLSAETTKRIGPVYKDLFINSSSSVLIADFYGSIHCVPFDVNAEVGGMVTSHVSNFPLSSPSGVRNDGVVVGSNDGILYRLGCDLASSWKVYIGGCIYAKPLVLLNDTIVACTTAGDVVHVNEHGSILWRYRVGAEVWSDPTLLSQTGSRIRVAFGARDSRVHIVSIGNEENEVIT